MIVSPLKEPQVAFARVWVACSITVGQPLSAQLQGSAPPGLSIYICICSLGRRAGFVVWLNGALLCICSQCLSVWVIISFLLFLLFPGSSKQERYEFFLSSCFAKISSLFLFWKISLKLLRGIFVFGSMEQASPGGLQRLCFLKDIGLLAIANLSQLLGRQFQHKYFPDCFCN